MLFFGCIALFFFSLKKKREPNHCYKKEKKEHALRCPRRTCARARVMGEVKEVQEQMKADTEPLKGKMATMMEAMMSMKKIMEAKCGYSCRY